MSLSLSQHPLAQVMVSRLRDRTTTSASFRHFVHELTTLLIADALADLPLAEEDLETPLTAASGVRPACPVVFVPILRAGLGMAEAGARLLPEAPVCHLGLYRDEETLQPVTYYDRVPHRGLAQAITILLDPMLATAGTATAAADVVRRHGAVDVRFVGLIGAPEGVGALADAHPDVPVFLAALDDRLTTADDPFPPGYILPGLGDAGDRQFGTG